MPNAGALTYWYLQVPNLVLSALILLLLLRLVLPPVTGITPIARPVRAVTQPIVSAVGAVTPRIIPAPGVILCALVWLFAARVLLFMAASALGVRL
jgi:hypothetical protein